MRWAFMGIPTAILMWSEAGIAARPAVSVALAGIESGANLDTDRFGFSVEATDINETGFKVTIRRLQGVLYVATVNWLAYGPKKPWRSAYRTRRHLAMTRQEVLRREY